LLTLLELRREAYVIQVDSDTVTLGPVDEVRAAIDAGRNFTLRGEASAARFPVLYYARDSRVLPEQAHVQVRIEAQIDQVAARLPALKHYVRGCAGFAGFAPGGLDRSFADAFSREASRLLGAEVWAQWGSEQVMSNAIIANEGEPLLLPYDRYLNFWNEPVGADVAFVHYLGTYRYHRGAYAGATARAIANLRRI